MGTELASWVDIAPLLAPWADREGHGSKCGARLLDTIIFGKDAGASPFLTGTWIFTSKNGSLVTKKPGQITLDRVLERFSRFSSMNPLNTERFVATVLLSSGETKYFRKEDLVALLSDAQEAINNLSKYDFRQVEAVQVYLRPRNGAEETFYCTYEAGPQSIAQCRFSRKIGRHSTRVQDLSDSWDPAARGEMEQVVQSVISHIEKSLSRRVSRLQVSFILDDNHQAWLCDMSQLSLTAMISRPSSEADSRDGRAEEPLSLPRIPSMRPASEPDQGLSSARKAAIRARVNGPRTVDDSVVPGLYEDMNPEEQSSIQHSSSTTELITEEERAREAADARSSSLQRRYSSAKPAGAVVRKTKKRQQRHASDGGVDREALAAFAMDREQQKMSQGHDQNEGNERKLRQRSSDRRNRKLEEERVAELEEMAALRLSQAAEAERRIEDVKSERARAVSELKSRVGDLDKEVKTLRKKLTTNEQAKQKAFEQTRELAKKLAATQAQFANAMREKDSAVEQLTLSLEERHNSELSTLLRDRPARGEGDTHAEEIAELVQRIEQLTQDLTDQQKKFASEKRQLQSDAATSLQQASAEQRQRLLKETSKVEVLEDKINEIDQRLSESRQQVLTWQQREEEAVRRKEQLETMNEELRSELRTLQQSYQVSTSLDVAQGEFVRDGESTIAAMSAQSEARIRQLNNKVEFLKASLAAEQQRYADLESQMNETRRKMTELKSEVKRRHLHGEQRTREAVEKAESDIRSQVDEAQHENTQLQARIASLQAQLSDALNDVAVSKRKEDAARGETSKVEAELGAVRSELEQQSAAEEEMSELQAKVEEADRKRATAEALVRRLENERAYLRSQLTSEITLKNELQTTLEQATRSLGELKQETAAEREAHSSDLTKRTKEWLQLETELRNANLSLDAECKEKTKQLEATRALFAKTRDQLRVDQSSLESMRAVNRRLMDELKATQEQLSASEAHTQELQARVKESMGVARKAVEDNAVSTSTQVNQLREALQSALNKASDAQREMLEMRATIHQSQSQAKRETGAAIIGFNTDKALKRKLAKALGRWKTAVHTQTNEELTLNRIAKALRDAEAQAKEREAESVSAAEARLRAEHESRAKEQSIEFDQTMRKAVEDVLEDAQAKSQALIDTLKQSHEHKVKALEAEKLESLRLVEESHSRALEEQAKVGLQQAESAVRETARKALEEKQRALMDAEERWRALLQERERAVRQEGDQRLREASEESDRVLAEHTEALRRAKEAMERDTDERTRQAETTVKELQAEISSLHETVSHLHSQLDESKQALTRQAEDHKVVLEVEKNEAVQSARVDWESELEAMKTKWSMESEAKAQQAMQEIRDSMGDHESKALRLQRSKWERTMEEMEVRLEAEKQAAWRKGMEERDKLAGEEAERLKQAAAKALEEVKQSAKQSLEGAHKDAKEAAKRAQRAGIEHGREEARKEFEQKEKQQRQEFELEKAALSRQALEERGEAVDAVREKEQARVDALRSDMERQRGEWIAEREKLEGRVRQLDSLISQKESEQRSMEERHRHSLSRSEREAQVQQREALDRQEQQLRRELEESIQQERERHEQAKREAIRACEERVAKDMGGAMQQLQDESEQLISQLEGRMVDMKRTQEERDGKIKELQAQIEEHDDTIYDLNQSLAQEKEDSEALKAEHEKRMHAKEEEFDHKFKLAKEVWQGEVEEANRSAQLRDDAMRAQLDKSDELIEASEGWRKQMHDTLVNHKREALVQHQSQSSAIQRELESISMERDTLDTRKDSLLDELSEMEVSVKKLEVQIREHSQQSAMSEGRINVAYARKKKRLDEEYEVLLEAVDVKRRDLEGVDRQIEECNERRMEKEDALKILERKLVEVLVDQQKRLLKILTDAGVEHNRFRKEIQKGS